MERVLVLGRGGAGKSTLARQLGRSKGLPVHELDEHHWQAGLRPLEAEAWRALQQRQSGDAHGAVGHLATVDRGDVVHDGGRPVPRGTRASTAGLLRGCHTAAMALYGLTGAFLAAPGKRDELVAYMLEAAELMGAVPGCLMYLVSTTEDANEVAITELWTDEAAHEASLRARGVPELIERARPVISGMSGRSVLTVLGGKGLPTA